MASASSTLTTTFFGTRAASSAADQAQGTATEAQKTATEAQKQNRLTTAQLAEVSGVGDRTRYRRR
jgi:hypothetical protein